MSQKALGAVIATDLPVFIRDMLANAPQRAGNLNNWIFRAAKTLHKYCSPNEIVELLYKATRGEPLQHNEIERRSEDQRPAKSLCTLEHLRPSGRTSTLTCAQRSSAKLTDTGFMTCG